MGTININSIYLATEGEGVNLGIPQIFVRFQGCTIGCLNCDSKDTWDFSKGESKSLESVLGEIHQLGYNGLIKRVSITGGDPMHPKNLEQVINLAGALKKRGYFLNLEAAGTRVDHRLFDLLDFISFDYKTPSTGVKTPLELILKMHEQYPHKFQIKAVIQDKIDFNNVMTAYENIREKIDGIDFPWVLTPSYEVSEPFPKERFVDIINWNQEMGGPFRVIGQQHKWIFGPSKKQV